MVVLHCADTLHQMYLYGFSLATFLPKPDVMMTIFAVYYIHSIEI